MTVLNQVKLHNEKAYHKNIKFFIESKESTGLYCVGFISNRRKEVTFKSKSFESAAQEFDRVFNELTQVIGYEVIA